MSAFDDVVRAAALGTGNRPLSASALPSGIAEAIGQAQGAELVLRAAGAYATVQRAVLASPDAGCVELPPASQTPMVGPELADLLRRMVADGQHPAVVRRALEHVASRSRTLPAPLLHAVAGHMPVGERCVVDLLDERQRAVFAHIGGWEGSIRQAEVRLAPLDPAMWEQGDGDQRVAYIERLRLTDPAAARRLLADDAWLKMPARHRRRILAALRAGLEAADEDLLEARLDDRAHSVREQAAALLGLLPDSAFVARAQALAVEHLSVTKRGWRRPRIELRPPELTEELIRDQYRDRPPGRSMELHLVRDMVSRVPTWRWADLIGISAVALAKAPVHCGEETVSLFDDIVRAALHWRDRALANALIDSHRRDFPHEIITLLDPPHQAILLRRRAAESGWAGVLHHRRALPAELPAAMSVLLAKILAGTWQRHSRQGLDYLVSDSVDLLSGRCADEAVGEVLAILESARDPLASDTMVDTIITSLELRRELLEIITRETP